MWHSAQMLWGKCREYITFSVPVKKEPDNYKTTT